MDLKEQAAKRLTDARAAHDALTADFELRLEALPEDASADDVQSISDEMTPLLDVAEEQVTRTSAQFSQIEKVTEARVASAAMIPAGDLQVVEPVTYDRRNPRGNSFFGDLYAYQARNSRDALERLQRNTTETIVGYEERGAPLYDLEGRALSSSAGAGGDFLPPLYFGDLYAEFKRARRVFANLVRNLPLPATGNSITIPRMTGGAATAVQSADNANVTTVDATTSLLTVPVCTVAGYADLSRQIVERSDPGMDQIILEDILRDYNYRVNLYCVAGTGSAGQPLGVLNTSGINTITYSSGTATVPTLYPKLMDAVRQVTEAVFEETVGYVMTARRWAWAMSALDSQNRPLAVPNMNGPFNALAAKNDNNSSFVDNMVPAGWIGGLPVYIDETLPKAGGTGTNQDIILSGAFKEDILWEDAAGPRTFQFEGVTSQTAAIRTMVFGYMAFTAGRFPKANSVISGTGLSAPTF
jgi:HK97 family phage major capsid protein